MLGEKSFPEPNNPYFDAEQQNEIKDRYWTESRHNDESTFVEILDWLAGKTPGFVGEYDPEIKENMEKARKKFAAEYEKMETPERTDFKKALYVLGVEGWKDILSFRDSFNMISVMNESLEYAEDKGLILPRKMVKRKVGGKETEIKDSFGMELFITHVPDANLLEDLSGEFKIPIMGLHYRWYNGQGSFFGKLVFGAEKFGRAKERRHEKMAMGADDRIVTLANQLDVDITVHPNDYEKFPDAFKDSINDRALLENLPAKGKDIKKIQSKEDLEAWTDKFIEYANKHNVRGITLDTAHLAAIYAVMKNNREEELRDDETRQFILSQIKKFEDSIDKPIENIHLGETRNINWKGSPIPKPRQKLEDGVSLTRHAPGSPRMIKYEKLMQEWIAGNNFPNMSRATQEVWPSISPKKTIVDVVTGGIFMWQCLDLWQMTQARAQQKGN